MPCNKKKLIANCFIALSVIYLVPTLERGNEKMLF